eukprot:353182-Chlamydomonas_euryale.AAC.52
MLRQSNGASAKAHVTHRCIHTVHWTSEAHIKRNAHLLCCMNAVTASCTCVTCLLLHTCQQARCYTFSGKPASEQWSSVPELGAADVDWFHMDSFLKLTPTAEAQGRKAMCIKAIKQNICDHTLTSLRSQVPLPGGVECQNQQNVLPRATVQAINLWGHDKCVSLPLTSCPGNCSGHGVCIDSCFPEDPNRAPWCECHKGFSGHECLEVDTSLCLNNCSDRGNCIRGFCHCKPPFFGLDCSRSQHVAARPDVLPNRSRPVVYMYELPHSLSTRLPLDDDVPDEVSIYSSYLHFLSIFLGDWATRTEDPWAANLFYIPAFTYSYTSNSGDPSPYVQRVMQHIRTSYPFFNRTHGKDHFMWLVGDNGACDLSLEASNIIKISHFGYHADVRIQGPSQMGRNAADPVHGCFNPARDIVAAPYNDLGQADAQNTYAEIVASKGAAPNREKLFFFAGGVRPENTHYSGGVRQAIAEMLKQTFNVDKLDGQYDDVVFIHGSTDNYRELYNTTKFCLAPHGSGFGIRLSIAMVHGCIPVIIQDHVYQPYESIVPYDEMSVRIAKSEIPDLLPILRGISEEEQSSMRLKMAQYYKAFIWERSHEGEAYNYTIEALFKRVHAMWGELY